VVKLSKSGTLELDFGGRRCVLEIKMAAKLPEVQITAGFTDTHVVPKTIHGFMTMYETSKYPAMVADAISCRKSKMAAN